jgi:hypothetical protein
MSSLVTNDRIVEAQLKRFACAMTGYDLPTSLAGLSLRAYQALAMSAASPRPEAAAPRAGARRPPRNGQAAAGLLVSS